MISLIRRQVRSALGWLSFRKLLLYFHYIDEGYYVQRMWNHIHGRIRAMRILIFSVDYLPLISLSSIPISVYFQQYIGTDARRDSNHYTEYYCV